MVGPHQVHHELQQNLRTVSASVHECLSKDCCSEHGIEKDHFAGDPGMAQCCIQELEDKEKLKHVWHAMRQVDPVAKVERVQDDLKAGLLGNHQTPQGWIDQEKKHVCNKDCTIHTKDEDADSDDELDDFLADFEGLSTSETSKKDDSIVYCESSQEMAQFLSTPLTNKQVRLVAFVDDSPCSHTVLSKLAQITKSTTLPRLNVACVQFDLIGRSHPLFRAELFVLDTFNFAPPFLVCFDQFNLPQEAISRRDLERDPTCTVTWWLEKSRALDLVDQQIHGEVEESEAEKSYCGRPGCRTFPHEHVKRTQYSETEYI